MKQRMNQPNQQFQRFWPNSNVDVADVKGCHVGHETKKQGNLFEILLLEKRLMHQIFLFKGIKYLLDEGWENPPK